MPTAHGTGWREANREREKISHVQYGRQSHDFRGDGLGTRLILRAFRIDKQKRNKPSVVFRTKRFEMRWSSHRFRLPARTVLGSSSPTCGPYTFLKIWSRLQLKNCLL